MDDDIYEVHSYQGRHFLKLLRCVECKGLSSPTGMLRGVCKSCGLRKQREWSRKSKEAIGRRYHLERLKNPGKKRRYAMQVQASPKWRDQGQIDKLYEEAQRRTEETGVVHHVDHIYPIQGVLCCGLHVHHNMRVISASENCSKNNGHPMHESPALEAFITEYGETGFYRWLRWFKQGLELDRKKK